MCFSRKEKRANNLWYCRVPIVPSAQAAEKPGIKGDKGLSLLMLRSPSHGRIDVEGGQRKDHFEPEPSDAWCDIFEEE